MSTLTQHQPATQLQRDARSVAADILRLTTPDERTHIIAYGAHLLDSDAPPDEKLVLRFWRELHILSPRLPRYLGCVARATAADLSRLQDEIARCVARRV